MSDGLKGAVLKYSGPHGTGATGGPWPDAMIDGGSKGQEVGGLTQNRSTIQSGEKSAAKIKGVNKVAPE